MDDRQIVELYWQRTEQAIFETAEKYGRYCYSIAYNILACHEDAEECVSDTYHDAWHAIPPARPSVLSAFLGKITRRISIDRYRYKTAAKRGGGELPLVLDELAACVSGDSVEDELERQRLSQTVNGFVRSLPKAEKKVFLLRYWYMDSIEDISKQLCFSQSKVKSILYRQREKLRKILQKENLL